MTTKIRKRWIQPMTVQEVRDHLVKVATTIYLSCKLSISIKASDTSWYGEHK